MIFYRTNPPTIDTKSENPNLCGECPKLLPDYAGYYDAAGINYEKEEHLACCLLFGADLNDSAEGPPLRCDACCEVYSDEEKRWEK